MVPQKCVLLILTVLMTMASLCYGESPQQKKVGVTLNTKFVSKHIWRGFDVFKDKGAVQPSLNLDWFGSGFTSTLWSCWSFSSGNEDGEEMDYIMAYRNSLMKDTVWTIDYSINWIYYDFPHTYSKHKDAQEIGVKFSWPKLFTVGGNALVPSYYVGKLWPARSNADNSECGGWAHIFGLGYDLPVADLLAVGQTQIIHLSTELVYNDGMGGADVDHDWSNVVFGISTDIPFGAITLKPELNYQISMDRSVNEENELWCTLNVSYKF